MTDLDHHLLTKHWIHSHEEDHEGKVVYRPSNFDFPLSRGRDGFVLHDDQSAERRGIGPADKKVSQRGQWSIDDKQTLTIDSGGAGGSRVKWSVVELTTDKLVLRRPGC